MTTLKLVVACATTALALPMQQEQLPGRLFDSSVAASSNWFDAGNVSVTVGGQVYGTADGTLKNVSYGEGSGSDKLGGYVQQTTVWMAGTTKFVTEVQTYTSGNIVLFSQTFPDGAEGTANPGTISSCFPSIDPTPKNNASLGYVSWQGRFLEASHGGVWQNGQGKGQPGVGTGTAGGPFVVFDETMSTTLVFSPSSNFMTMTLGQAPSPNTRGVADNSFCFGLDGPVASVPAGYKLQTMLYIGEGEGVNKAMKGFGTILMGMYNTVRRDDYATHWLGFSTDNGAYYYYNTAPGKFAPGPKETYQQTLRGVHDYAQKEDIPYKHMLLDSWWYTKGNAGGVKEWDATNSTFPDGFPNGLTKFAGYTGYKFQMHNRHWSDNNIYAKQNGGKYDYILEPTSTVAPKEKWGIESGDPGHSGLGIPTDQNLWDDLIANKTNNGVPMVVYEQDWMYNEWEGLNMTRASPTLSRQWLMQMGNGASKSNVTIQYCMTYARMILQSAEIPAVTSFRASDDYGPGQTGYYPTEKNPDGSGGCRFPYCVYYVGTTSIIAWALDLRPSKDNYWSIPLQPGSAFNHNKYPSTYNDTHEPYNEMQGAVSAYTTAMVATSDGIGYSNASLIKMTCRTDGYLLQPSAPARAIDMSFSINGAPVAHVEHVHPIMSTFSEIDGIKWGHILVIGLNSSWTLKPSHLGDDIDTSVPQLLWSGYQPFDTDASRPANITIRESTFTEAAPLQLERCLYADFNLWHTAPILSLSKAAFLGEVGKWVPIAAGRVTSVTDSTDGITVGLVGAPDEMVQIAFASAAGQNWEPSTVWCTINASGTGTVTYHAGSKPVCA